MNVPKYGVKTNQILHQFSWYKSLNGEFVENSNNEFNGNIMIQHAWAA